MRAFFFKMALTILWKIEIINFEKQDLILFIINKFIYQKEFRKFIRKINLKKKKKN